MTLKSFLRSTKRKVLTVRNTAFNLADRPVVVLLYHRVTTLENDPQQLSVSPENFYQQLKYIKNSYPLLRFEDDWANIREPSVVITFDDGYADNCAEALPILDSLSVPATFFVSTGNIDTQNEFWWDELERLILRNKDYPAAFQYSHYYWPTNSYEQRIVFYKDLHPIVKMMKPAEREKLFAELVQWSQLGKDGRITHRSLTREELVALANNECVTIGAHTVSHTCLSMLSKEEQLTEIKCSKETLEKWLNIDINVFSYPFGGKKDYDKQSVEICKKIGFTKVAANFRGQAHRWTDSYQIPRQLVRNWPPKMFEQQINKFWTL